MSMVNTYLSRKKSIPSLQNIVVIDDLDLHSFQFKIYSEKQLKDIKVLLTI